MRYLKLIFILQFSFLILVPNGYAQVTQVDSTKYEKRKSDLDLYATKKELRLKKTDYKPPTITKTENPLPTTDIGKTFSYMVIIAMVIFLLVFLISNLKIDKNLEKPMEMNFDEIENIEEVDTYKGLDYFLEKGDYREGFRMLFLRVLQKLQLDKVIDWKKEKTNRDYVQEMKKDSRSGEFNRLANSFEFIWYGDQPIEKQEFENSLPLFDAFLDDINYLKPSN